MKKSIIISALIVAALVAGSVFAWGHGRGQDRGDGYGMDYGFNSNCQGNGGQGNGGQGAWNNLSKEQNDELAALRKKFFDETSEIRKSMFKTKEDLRILMETAEPDRTEIEKLSEQIAALQKQIRDNRIDFLLSAKKIAPEFTAGIGFGKRHGHRKGYGYNQGCRNNNF